MNRMTTNDDPETNLVVALSHLQLGVGIDPSNEKCKLSIPTRNAGEMFGPQSCSPESEAPSPSSRRKIWQWITSPQKNSKSQGKKNSKRTLRSSFSGSFDRLDLGASATPPLVEPSCTTRPNWLRRRTKSSSSRSRNRDDRKVFHCRPIENVEGDFCDGISDISGSQHSCHWPDADMPTPLELEADIRDPVAQEEDKMLSKTTWIIHVLDERVESTTRFRIYFRRDDDFVYYRGKEIIDYVRDLIEFDGRFLFNVIHMSTGKSQIVQADSILCTLGKIVHESTAPRSQLKQGMLKASLSTQGSNHSLPIELTVE